MSNSDFLSSLFDPLSNLFKHFSTFLSRVELFSSNFVFVLFFVIWFLLVLAFFSFPFWFPRLLSRLGIKRGELFGFLDKVVDNLLKLFT